MKTITGGELVLGLSADVAPLLIDVLPEEEFQRKHLPGARNACVFNVTFLDEVKRLAPDRGRPVVVYGLNSADFASATAAEKLVAAGYAEVADYRGGLDDWVAAGQPVEGTGAVRLEQKPSDGRHDIDLERSRVEWAGRNLLSAHFGTIKLRSGHIEIEGGRPVRGAFTLDMDSIENFDIEPGPIRQMLINHLKSDDFFDVSRFPDAEFRLKEITYQPNARPGSLNSEVAGEFTLKGVTHHIEFPAIVGLTPDGLLAADAHFDIDRTRWNVLYGSGKFYQKLGKHLVHDEISIALKLVTGRG